MTAPTEAPWGPGKPPFIIAEVGLTHEGSLGNALAFIDACADVGASAVKFQCHDDDPNDVMPERYCLVGYGSRRKYWRQTGFPPSTWYTLRQRCERDNVLFGCTPFSHLAIHNLRHGPPHFYKIARQHYNGDIHWAVLNLGGLYGRPVLHTGPTGLGLNEYLHGVHIGISDHSASIAPSVDAFKRGAQVCEVHVCWDRRQFGPDVSMSVTIDELAELVRAVK